MPAILILSSHVAASAVGGSAQGVALARMGIETALVPTVLLGRHPGLGAPGGGAVSDAIFEGMLEGVAATGLLGRLDAVITGYFASPGQVAAAARIIGAVRAASPGARIVVDPIMGDYPGGLYVPETVALAIVADLIPLGVRHIVIDPFDPVPEYLDALVDLAIRDRTGRSAAD